MSWGEWLGPRVEDSTHFGVLWSKKKESPNGMASACQEEPFPAHRRRNQPKPGSSCVDIDIVKVS